MSWLSKLRGAAPIQRDATEDRLFGVGGTASEIGVAVTIDRARQVPVARDCLKVLADSVAGLAFGVFRRGEGGRVDRIDNHPVARLIEAPNRRQTSFDFLACLTDDLVTEGNAYHEIVAGDGRIGELRRLPPSRVQVEETVDGTKRFRVTTAQGAQRVLLEDEVWHLALPPMDSSGLRGRSPILHDGLEAIGVAIALQHYANSLFTNDATPPLVLTMAGNFKDAESRANWLTAWRRWTTGRNRHSPAVLEYGMVPHRLGLTAEEAQFLETRRELWLDITRLWRVPPHKVGMLERSTNNNIEHQGLEFVTDTVRPLLELIERSVTRFLIDDPGVFFEFDVSSLLRGDIKSRYEAYALGRQWGWLSVNDVLRAEHRNGIGPAGDRYIEPLNMVPVGAGAADRDPARRDGTARAIAYLRESVARHGGRPRLEVIRNAA